MQRSLAVALFLALSLISALALPADVVNGHYPGRSGDFVLRQKVRSTTLPLHISPSSHVFLFKFFFRVTLPVRPT
jgi:hypothetical protein